MAIPQPLDTGLMLDPAVNTAATEPPRANFQSYRCRTDHLGQFFRRVTGSGPVAPEFMPMAQLLNRSCAGDFADLVQLKEQVCGGGHEAPKAATIRAMRDLFLAIPNRRLQRLYRDYFTASPVGPVMRHEEKITALDNVRERAQRIVAAYDWRWLADWLRLDLIGETAEAVCCGSRTSRFRLSGSIFASLIIVIFRAGIATTARDRTRKRSASRSIRCAASSPRRRPPASPRSISPAASPFFIPMSC